MEDNLSERQDQVTGWEIALMFFLLSISGNPFISIKQFEFFLIASVIIPVVHIAKNYNKSISFRTVLIFFFFLGYEAMHALLFKLDYTLTIFKLFLVLLLAIVIVDILKDRFIKVFTKTMVIISLVSFVFVFLCYIPGINHALYSFAADLFPLDKDWKGHSTPTLLIFTFHPEFFTGTFSYVRNAGIFWESGAFAVFLNIALYLHYCSKQIISFRDLFDTSSIILLVALVSTTSTMGLTGMMIILTFFSTQLKTAVKFVLIVFIALASYLAFSTVEFLGDKVTRELSESRKGSNRFGSALKDFEDIAERPLLGWSRRIEVVFGTAVFDERTHRPNGFTNFLRSYGLIYFSVYFILVYLSFKNIWRFYHHTSHYTVPAFGILMLWIISFSEVIFDLVFLKSLIFLYAVYKPSGHWAVEMPAKKPFYFLSALSSAFTKKSPSNKPDVE
jgi:hypothetical protein